MYLLSVRNKQRAASAHRLVYEAFVGAIPKGLTINHKNGDKTDNRLGNLEVVTPSENTRHAIHVLGRKLGNRIPNPGEKNGRAKLTEDNVRDIRKRYAAGDITQAQLAKRYGVANSLISFIIARRNWSHIA